MKVTLPLEIQIDCKSNCSKCKWGYKPSTCGSWDEWRVNNKIPMNLFIHLVKQADEYYLADKS
jgi:hypothetical protein